MQTEASPAEIKITNEHIQEPVIWTQRLPKDDSKIPKVQLVRISLNSLAASSLWENNSSVTLTTASTHAIRTPSKNHYQNAIGLVLYMGGAPEEIEELLDTSIVSSSLKKHAYSIGAVAKRTAAKRSGSTPCQRRMDLKLHSKIYKESTQILFNQKQLILGNVRETVHTSFTLFTIPPSMLK